MKGRGPRQKQAATTRPEFVMQQRGRGTRIDESLDESGVESRDRLMDHEEELSLFKHRCTGETVSLLHIA